MERNLHTADGAIVGEADLDGNVETSIVVRMNVESYGGGEKCRGVEEEIHLRKVAHRRRIRTRLQSGVLRDRDVLHRLTIAGFVANVGCYVARQYSVSDGEDWKKPCW